MRIGAGMLLFDLFDSGLAFFLVYYVVKAKFGGDSKAIARILGAFFGIVTFIIYFGVIVWFNSYPVTAPDYVKTTVYLAPIVLSVLMLILVQLSKPSKSPVELPEAEDDEESSEQTEGEGAEEETEQ
ncbi:MAG: hypothetical protein J6P16_06030 [Eubacterium sp.]|nr:hypothetical protein [Eubacterium sp.]